MARLPAIHHMSEQHAWIFGYGSLIHKPGFEYCRRVEGYIRGYRRVFWQGSTDHRGTPQAPGRTVTLQPCDGVVTWGVAFQLAGTPEEQEQTLKYLEWREKQYDVRHRVNIYTSCSSEPAVSGALVYIASENKQTNVNYLGPASELEIAQQIATAKGPSGPNTEYLFKLADAMREMSVDDPELFALERSVKDILRQLQPADASLVGPAAGGCDASGKAVDGRHAAVSMVASSRVPPSTPETSSSLLPQADGG